MNKKTVVIAKKVQNNGVVVELQEQTGVSHIINVTKEEESTYKLSGVVILSLTTLEELQKRDEEKAKKDDIQKAKSQKPSKDSKGKK